MTMRTGGGLAAALMLGLLAAGCMQTVALDLPTTGSGGGAGNLGGSGVDGSTDGGGGGSDGPNDHIHCISGGSPSSLSAAHVPTIIIALGRSSSMDMRLGPGNGTRFSVTHDAVKDVLNNYGSLVQFGYLEFPGIPPDGSCSNANGCCASDVSALVKAGGQLKGINDQLDACSNSSQVGCPNTPFTPTLQAISRIRTNYDALNNITGPRYALLITDGEPSCGSGASMDPPCMQTKFAIQNLLLSQIAVETYVVGVGDIPGAPNAANNGNFCLDSLAQAGGTPLRADPAPPPYYYPATTAPLVEAYLTSIVRSAICHIDISDPSFDPDQVEVDLNGTSITRDVSGQNGWNFDAQLPSRINIYGAACNNFISGLKTASHLVVVRTCPMTSH